MWNSRSVRYEKSRLKKTGYFIFSSILISSILVNQGVAAPAKTKYFKPIYSSNGPENLKLIDPQTKKAIPTPVLIFWAKMNDMNSWISGHPEIPENTVLYDLNPIWFSAINDGYYVQASVPTSRIKEEKGYWTTPSKVIGTDAYAVLGIYTPGGTPCETLGSTARFRDLLFTCISSSSGNVFDNGVVSPVEDNYSYRFDNWGKEVESDGYPPEIDAPGRLCSQKDAVSKIYGYDLKCKFVRIDYIPQVSYLNQLTSMNNLKEAYCFFNVKFVKLKSINYNKNELGLYPGTCARFVKQYKVKTQK